MMKHCRSPSSSLRQRSSLNPPGQCNKEASSRKNNTNVTDTTWVLPQHNGRVTERRTKLSLHLRALYPLEVMPCVTNQSTTPFAFSSSLTERHQTPVAMPTQEELQPPSPWSRPRGRCCSRSLSPFLGHCRGPSRSEGFVFNLNCLQP